MELEIFTNGLFDSNAYLLYEGGKGILIDAGVPKKRILGTVWEKNIEVDTIILTHGHIDHIYYVDEIKKALNAKVAIHESEAETFNKSEFNGSSLFGMPKELQKADIVLSEENTFKLGDTILKLIYTPGHSPGCICIHANDYLFSGDTLFKQSIGRTDLPGGSMDDIISSIRQKLFSLPDNTEVFPGHGPSTSIEYERKNNPFVK